MGISSSHHQNANNAKAKPLTRVNSIQIKVNAISDTQDVQERSGLIEDLEGKNLLTFRLMPMETNNESLGATLSQPIAKRSQSTSYHVPSQKLFSPRQVDDPTLRRTPSVSVSVQDEKNRLRSFIISAESYSNDIIHSQSFACTNSVSEEFSMKLKRLETAKKRKDVHHDLDEEMGFQFIPVDLLSTTESHDEEIEEIILQ